jgi:cyclic beta-1,2-glucan synthetase
LVQSESQQQAADQVSVSNSIGSLRFLGAMDWQEFVETMSAVEHTLRKDVGGVYGRMDFGTRDRYRHAVETMARRSRLTESAVAHAAIQLARESAGNKGEKEREAHVGFFLIDKGVSRLEQILAVRLTASEVLRRLMAHEFALPVYLTTILLVTFILSVGLIANAHAGGLGGWGLASIGALLVLGISQLGVALVNWLATLFVLPNALPRMDFSVGIPPECRTLAVVPAMLTSSQNIEELIEALEVRFLANRDDNLHFSLLTDFRDAHQETLPEDEPLLRLAPLECTGRALDGLRAQTRETRGVEFASSRRDK